MNDFPLISVVIPVYNRELSVATAIRSTVSLAPMPYEVVVVDDGSFDNSSKVAEAELRKIGCRYTVIVNPRNRGVSYSRNIGVSKASGKWVIFLDSDDEYLEEAGQALLSCLDDDFDYVAFSYYVNGFKAPAPQKIDDLFFEFLNVKFFNTNTIACKREVFESLNFREGFPIGEDTDLWARILFYKKGFFSDIPFAKYNLEHKIRVPGRHPFYDITLAELDLSEEIKDKLYSRYKRYCFLQRCALREVSLCNLILRFDFKAALYYMIGVRNYGAFWVISRWLKK
jgi:glycosyltransferase involved in cell wall biosynthesis